jgi:hypothetical protein
MILTKNSKQHWDIAIAGPSFGNEVACICPWASRLCHCGQWSFVGLIGQSRGVLDARLQISAPGPVERSHRAT